MNAIQNAHIDACERVYLRLMLGTPFDAPAKQQAIVDAAHVTFLRTRARYLAHPSATALCNSLISLLGLAAGAEPLRLCGSVSYWNGSNGFIDYRSDKHVDSLPFTLIRGHVTPRVGMPVEFAINMHGHAWGVIAMGHEGSIEAYARQRAVKRSLPALRRVSRHPTENSADRDWLRNDGVRILTPDEKAANDAILRDAGWNV